MLLSVLIVSTTLSISLVVLANVEMRLEETNQFEEVEKEKNETIRIIFFNLERCAFLIFNLVFEPESKQNIQKKIRIE